MVERLRFYKLCDSDSIKCKTVGSEDDGGAKTQ